ncbi:acetyltransferase [Candidatus Bipolaricaulota bacterium]|nr:acetyltransferase [Candidatus Bipolaricaulota bacterium]
MGIAIVGAGGHGRVAFECLRLSRSDNPDVVFYDDRYEQIGEIEGIPVRGPISALFDADKFELVFVAIGDNVLRYEITQRLQRAGRTLISIIHPHTAISPRSRIAVGTIAVAGTVVNFGAQVGRGVILNTLSSVGHDCIVQDFAQLASGVNLGGAAVIEEGVFVGIGAKVAPETTIGAWSVVGAGSIVLEDQPPRSFCCGAPARVIRPLGDDELPHPKGSST